MESERVEDVNDNAIIFFINEETKETISQFLFARNCEHIVNLFYFHTISI